MTLYIIRQAKFADFSSCKPFSSADLSFRMIPAHAADLEIDSAMTLNQAKVGCDVQIRLLNGPGCERLRDLGFCEQLQVRKIAGGRNLICSICGTRMAISRELAEQVLVSPVV
jgi:Fe2+ transport system protein FeoA